MSLPSKKDDAGRLLAAGEDSRKNWQSINQLRQVVAGLQTLVADLNRRIARSKMDMPDDLFPFKIYQVPSVFRAYGTASPDDWRKFRVRNGSVLNSDVSTADPTGTDGIENPDDPTYPDVADILVPEGVEQYWFWLDLSGAAAVMHDDDPTTAGWSAFPVVDKNHIPIGVVDTLTNQDDQIALVRQYLRTDVLASGAGGGVEFEDYDPTHTYHAFGFVRVTAGNSQGTWINVSGGDLTGVDPVWPEPTPVKWKMIAFGAQVTDACDGGDKTVTINATPPTP